jgi:hypothetical protein
MPPVPSQQHQFCRIQQKGEDLQAHRWKNLEISFARARDEAILLMPNSNTSRLGETEPHRQRPGVRFIDQRPRKVLHAAALKEGACR